MTKRIKLTNNFYEDEFICKCGCGAKEIDKELLINLQLARDELGVPMQVTSGLRCKNWNSKVGGSDHSAHLSGKAVDIATNSSRSRYNLVRIMLKFFKRIGIAKSFIHVDVDYMKTNPVIWTY